MTWSVWCFFAYLINSITREIFFPFRLFDGSDPLEPFISWCFGILVYPPFINFCVALYTELRAGVPRISPQPQGAMI
jgi:hypothetical protein